MQLCASQPQPRSSTRDIYPLAPLISTSKPSTSHPYNDHQKQKQQLTQACEQKPRMPPLTSCYECHMRWYSCDKGTPCAKCVKHGRVCTYEKTMVDGTEVSRGDDWRWKRCGVLIRKKRYLTPANRTRNGKLLVPDAPAAVPQVVVHPVVATRATDQAAPPAPAPRAAAPRSIPRARAYMAASQAEIDPGLRASSPSLQNQEQNQEQIQESEPRGKKKPIVLTGCRACHLCSIKCNGDRPCLPCSHSNVSCTYDKTMVNGEPVSFGHSKRRTSSTDGVQMYLRDDGHTRNGELVVPDYDPSLPTATLYSWRSASGARAADFDVSVDPFPVGDTYQDEEEEIQQNE